MGDLQKEGEVILLCARSVESISYHESCSRELLNPRWKLFSMIKNLIMCNNQAFC